jgi:hypothetical protein
LIGLSGVQHFLRVSWCALGGCPSGEFASQFVVDTTKSVVVALKVVTVFLARYLIPWSASAFYNLLKYYDSAPQPKHKQIWKLPRQVCSGHSFIFFPTRRAIHHHHPFARTAPAPYTLALDPLKRFRSSITTKLLIL